MTSKLHKETPWDTKVFGIYTAEVLEYSEHALELCNEKPGLYTIKLDALADKSLAYTNGFYYCDTLLVPECKKIELKQYEHPDISFDLDVKIEEILNICNGAFRHGRFHRDFHLDKLKADARYNQWLLDIHAKGKIYALRHKGILAGFIAVSANELQLHAVANEYRGRGYAKYWWSMVCDYLFAQGCKSIQSSVSASNLAVVNLYSSLGFRFVSATDVYHKRVT